jgi:hypothetical protein
MAKYKYFGTVLALEVTPTKNYGEVELGECLLHFKNMRLRVSYLKTSRLCRLK